jgi:hypothetical protein
MYDDETRHTAGQWWPEYLQEFRIWSKGCMVTYSMQMKFALMHVAGEPIRRIVRTLLPDTATATFDDVVRVLSEHFEPMRNRLFSSHQLGQIVQSEYEGTADYVIRLRHEARMCGFADVDFELKRQFVALFFAYMHQCATV